jgi:hypothetical protein
MADSSKTIQFSGHASQQLQFRGTTESEVIEAIRTARWQPADNGRMECRKDYAFNSLWNRRHYATKQVRPIFLEEADRIAVVTVYVYYF